MSTITHSALPQTLALSQTSALSQTTALPQGSALPQTWDNDSWRAEAACAGIDTALFFPEEESEHLDRQSADAKSVCADCPVKMACLEFALRTNQPDGIWGGMNETERRRERRRRRRSAARPVLTPAA
jgi:WhiB family transcriptional regulator, redox-sensing transcriptional regulator